MQKIKKYVFPDVGHLRLLEWIEIDIHDLDKVVTPFEKQFESLEHLRRLETGFCDFNLEPSTFSNVRQLEHIDMSHCNLTWRGLCVLCKRTNLKYLNLAYIINIKGENDLFSDCRSSVIKTLILTDSFRNLKSLTPNMFYQGLQKLYLNRNSFTETWTKTNCTESLPTSLQELDLSDNEFRSLCLNMPNLSKLSLHGNSLGNFLMSRRYTNSPSTSLKYIDLSFNKIQTVIGSLFQGHKDLLSINLSNNDLTEIDFDLSDTQKLNMLDLTFNNIRILSIKTMKTIKQIIKRSNTSVDLSNNKIQCSCATASFLQWMLDNRKNFRNIDAYLCEFENGTIITNRFERIVMQFGKECISHSALIICVTVGLLAAVSVLVAGFIYRYRWKLRYIYYMTKNKYKKLPSDTTEEYTYNAFISYSDDEKEFIIKEIIPKLEDNANLKLCIHQRDFVPGEEISENITNDIHRSKKTACIVTRSFLDSYYCMFEFNMARMESIYSRDGRNILLLVFYEQILPRELPLVMLELVQQQSYIEFPNDEHGNELFWEKIKETIS